MAFAEAWQGLELVHGAGPWGVIGNDVMGPVVDDDVVELLVEVETVCELLVVLVGKEDVGELEGGADVVVVVVAEVTGGRAARQVQTAWADEDAGKAFKAPQELITHPMARFAML